ncbi:PREDICTED: probable sulfite oxidase, mitochondrial [Ceratosolen solmsi marchali]|uniref:Sulfite oxidase n=1 Tax=Ceratosolen solmsi marchali TaxID=326594 RepID=A0AAJ6YHB0_9HYME|nr:PREDICTED: probable sulfite oxidase, mitochondrial [Ceratosolen solmsi marchali]
MFRCSCVTFKSYWEHQYFVSKRIKSSTINLVKYCSSNDHKDNSSQNKRNTHRTCILIGLTLTGAVFFVSHLSEKKNIFQTDNILSQLKKKFVRNDTSIEMKNLPTYTINEVNKHDNIQDGIWIAYKEGVYNITNFVSKHPGGQNMILMAAGSYIDPFWKIFANHNNKETLKILESMRIGNLNSADVYKKIENSYNPYALEPKRSKVLKVNGKQPFCAEPPAPLLIENFITPSDIFYVRNHLPVPIINLENYELEFTVEDEAIKSLTLADIKKYPKYTITSAVMCGGNRRSEMAKAKPLRGLNWNIGAIGNASWSGARLCDVLQDLSIKEEDYNHLQFEGMDTDPSGIAYGASIPIGKGLDPKADVLLAYEMNGEEISLDHGYPIRVIVPGVVGARNVKWLNKIKLSKYESPSQFQQNDYKGFAPSINWDNVDFSKAPAIQEMPVTSAICTPQENSKITINKNGSITVKGYAWSGGGRKIIRVDVTADQGETWHVADLTAQDLNAKESRHYAWTLWSLELPVKKSNESIEIWVKAIDSAYNVQPESFKHIWNLRGFLCNAYHKVKVDLI